MAGLHLTGEGYMRNCVPAAGDKTLILSENQVGPSFFQAFESRFGTSGSVGIPSVPFSELSVKQQLICNTVKSHVDQSLDSQFSHPLRVIIIGQAGCGKSQVMLHLKNILETRRAAGEFEFKIGSFTGLSAHNIAGSTLHSSFKIPICKNPSEWPSHIEKVVNERMKRQFSLVAMILIDEFQMVSKNIFAYLDLFLRKCDPARAAHPFANRSIILAGDIWQFPPVADYSIFSPSLDGNETQREAAATKIYRREFRRVFILQECFRQDSEGEYFNFLCRLKKGESTLEDVAKLRQRLHTNVPAEEQDEFADALAVFPTRVLAHDHNIRKLFHDFDLNDIVNIDTGPAALTLARGAKVIITRNLTVAGGVFNGSVGTVVDWVYEQKVRATDEPKVDFIVVNVPSYDGNVFVKTERGQGLPIYRVAESELCTGYPSFYVSFKRFPVKLFSGSTGHKAIGLSLPKISVHLGLYEMFPAWAFVQLSRVKDFSCVLLLDKVLDDERLMKLGIKQKNFLRVVMREEQRLQKLEDDFVV